MSCKKCEECQDQSRGIAYYRWKNANIVVVGCNEHLKEIFEALNNIQSQRVRKEAKENERSN